jgi:hypothetical protein
MTTLGTMGLDTPVHSRRPVAYNAAMTDATPATEFIERLRRIVPAPPWDPVWQSVHQDRPPLLRANTLLSPQAGLAEREAAMASALPRRLRKAP